MDQLLISCFIVHLILFGTLFGIVEPAKETILMAPNEKGIWSWTSQWVKKDGNSQFYQVCDVSSASEPNKWLRSDEFLDGDGKRIDVTVQYAVSKCSSVNLASCKEYFKLFVYKTNTEHDNTVKKVPEPKNSPGSYLLFGKTSPTNLSSGSLSRNLVNTETYSFLTDKTKPYHYLAIQYQGGCFNLYSVSISYAVCPSLALPTSLIQLPRTIAPLNGTNQVPGSCASNAQPAASNVALYGDCNDNGEWSSQASGECLCKPGYGKYLNGSGAVCNECPNGTYQDKASRSLCKLCPLNSLQAQDRTTCGCAATFYRKSQEVNCSSQPGSPRSLNSTFSNATLISLTWSPPTQLGGRQDTYYQVTCNKCDKEATNCIMGCLGSVISHEPKTSRSATANQLSPFTYYKFTVIAKNGISDLAEMNGVTSKNVSIVEKTLEAVPGPVTMSIDILDDTTARLQMIVQNPNGKILSYVITYYPVDGEPKRTLNTTADKVIIKDLENGQNYVFEARARTQIGLGPVTKTTKTIETADKGAQKGNKMLSTEEILGIVIGVSLLIFIVSLVIIFVVYRRRRKKKGVDEPQNNMIPLHNERLFIDPTNYNTPLEALRSHTKEIDLADLQLKINIGEGEFAEVYKGILVNDIGREIVAVKMLKPGSSTKIKKEFIREASIMGQFKHPNVIELKGVVTRGPESPMMIITEFMENGSLDHFLNSRDGMLTPLQLVGIARGVANGMAYLAHMNFIHRDLAARNILLAENLASKISDFGLSRELDTSENNPDSIYITQGGKIPVRWTAPEAIRFRKYSSCSDVWSFGILLWEIMSFGERPYWDWENEEVLARVDEGYRLPPPMNCSKSIHDVMLNCWEKDMATRPTFPEILKKLDEMIRFPDKLRALEEKPSVSSQTNLGVVTSVEEWLIEINMRQYTKAFEQAGLKELYQVILLDEMALKRIGINLIGHRNRIYKSIEELRKRYNKEEFEITI